MMSNPDDIERQEKIRDQAHAIWVREGRPEGKHLEHWRQAQRSIAAEELRAIAAALDAGAVRHSKVKAYFDNVIVSGRVREDLEPEEIEAVQHLVIAEERGVLEIVTSREAWQQRTRDSAMLAQREQDRARIPPLQDNHRLLRIQHKRDPKGFVARPVPIELVDAPLFVALANAGLKPADARHLMYAVANSCDRFVTPDPFDNRPVLGALCRGLVIVKPSELVADLFAVHFSQQARGLSDRKDYATGSRYPRLTIGAATSPTSSS